MKKQEKTRGNTRKQNENMKKQTEEQQKHHKIIKNGAKYTKIQRKREEKGRKWKAKQEEMGCIYREISLEEHKKEEKEQKQHKITQNHSKWTQSKQNHQNGSPKTAKNESPGT